MRNKQNENENGRSMIEMLGVLAIIGVLLVGGIAGYSKAMHRYRLNKAIEQITYAAGAIRSFFAPQKNYDGLDACADNNSYCQLYKKAKLLPDDMWDETAGSYIGVYGYGVNLYASHKVKYRDYLTFSIFYEIGHTEESIAACIDLLTYDWNNAGVSVIELTGPAGGVLFKPQISIELAVDKCENVVKNYQKYSNYGAMFPYIAFYFDIDLNGDYWKNQTFAN